MKCLSYYAQRHFVLLKKMTFALTSIKSHQISTLNRLMNNRSQSKIAVVPCVSLLFSTVAHCAPGTKFGDKKNIKILEPKTLTYEYLIKQACGLNVDTATQLLTLTVTAILDLNKEYRETLQELISLTEESLQTISMSAYQEDLWDKIIESRSQMEDLKKSLLELTSFMEYVEKVASSAAEASYLGGADYASTAMCERINSAHQQLHIEQRKTKKLEEELLLTQESYVQKATSFEKKDDNEKQVESKRENMSLSQIVDQLSNEEQSDS